MEKRKTHQTDVTKQVIAVLVDRMKPGTPITAEAWNIAYEIVWAQRAIETMDWKQRFISEKVNQGFLYGR